MIKVAFIGQKGIPVNSGGVERYVENLANNLVKSGQEVLVYNRYNYLPERLHEFKNIEIVNTFYLKGKNLANITQTFSAVIDVLHRHVDVIHFQGIGPSLLSWLPKLLQPRLKIVATFHSFDYFNNKWSWFAKKMLIWGEYLMCRHADELIVLTAEMQSYVQQKYHRSAQLIPNGANLYLKSGQERLLPWGLAHHDYFLSVARIIKLKGLQYLITAFQKLETTKKLVIVGDGEYLSELKKLAANDKRIIFTGNQVGRTLDQLYAQAYLFIQSSEMEGLSTSLLEAMAHHTACLVSNIPANLRALADTGLSFISKDVLDLQNKLEYTLRHPEELKTKAQKAYQRIEQKFNWSKISQEILKVYEKLLMPKKENRNDF